MLLLGGCSCGWANSLRYCSIISVPVGASGDADLAFGLEFAVEVVAGASEGEEVAVGGEDL